MCIAVWTGKDFFQCNNFFCFLPSVTFSRTQVTHYSMHVIIVTKYESKDMHRFMSFWMFWYPVEDQKLDNEDAVRHVAIPLDGWLNCAQNKEVSPCCLKRNPWSNHVSKTPECREKLNWTLVYTGQNVNHPECQHSTKLRMAWGKQKQLILLLAFVLACGKIHAWPLNMALNLDHKINYSLQSHSALPLKFHSVEFLML